MGRSPRHACLPGVEPAVSLLAAPDQAEYAVEISRDSRGDLPISHSDGDRLALAAEVQAFEL
jgi:hypothetical protein